MRWRLVAAFVGVMVMVLLALGIPLASHLRNVEAERLTAELQRDAFILAGTAEDELTQEAPSDVATLQASVDLYAAREGATVAIVDISGVTIAAAGGDEIGDDLSATPEVATAIAGTPTSGRDGVVYVAVPVRSGARTAGAVRITFPADVIDSRANGKLRALVVVGLISLSASLIAALFMASTVVGPLRRLRRSTEVVAGGDFATRANTDEGPPEVRSLAVSFNAMTEQVARLVEQQRSFAGDASHQLRTPLTALRLQLERAAEVLDRNPALAHDRIEAAGVETERLQRMVEGLLLLARSDRTSATTETVDVGAIASERADIWRQLADERGIELHAHVDGAPAAQAVPGAVEQIIDNYLDNAISIVPDGSLVEVVVGSRDGWVEVHVLDRGPGMSDDHITHTFDRFWRAPGAPHEGSGLGLAIVEHLAAASGGQVAIANRIGGGIDASVRLRASAPPVQVA